MCTFVCVGTEYRCSSSRWSCWSWHTAVFATKFGTAVLATLVCDRGTCRPIRPSRITSPACRRSVRRLSHARRSTPWSRRSPSLSCTWCARRRSSRRICGRRGIPMRTKVLFSMVRTHKKIIYFNLISICWVTACILV